MNSKDLLPKTKEEFEAYARAMDAANDKVVKDAEAREKAKKKTGGKKPAGTKKGKK